MLPYHDIRLTAKRASRILRLVEGLVYRRRAPLGAFEIRELASPLELPDFARLSASDGWQQVEPFSLWGGSNVNFLLRSSFTVSPEFLNESPVALHLPIGEAGDFSHPEALVYIDGVSFAAVDRHHQEVLLPREYCDGQQHDLLLHGWTGRLAERIGRQLQMKECAIVQVDEPTRRLAILIEVTLETADLLDLLEPARTRLYNALEAMMSALDTREPLGDSFYASVSDATAVLLAGIEKAGPPLDAKVIAAGHAHIDVAWLWTLGQTRRKAGRTFHTVLRLMEQFPDYSFTQSQPHLYEVVQQDYPEAFDAIRQRVREGRWEPIGGMWVEADCNITGAESLARQFLLGRTWFRDQFGAHAESPVLWLPDVFGYAWNLPQLIKLAGLEYFFTIKIGWNQINKMPVDSFWWQGLDGTRVLTHFSTAPERHQNTVSVAGLLNSATYNANLSPFEVLGSWASLKQKESQRLMLMSYGYGDGGGGPTREMNEKARELHAFPALPHVTQGRVIDFFERLEAESGALLPVWNAELYLEIHRGTYTSQSRNKRANRKSEFLLHDTEFLAVAAALSEPSYVYPAPELRDAWKTICLNQFHDIIPGSSIGEVYDESQAQYAELRDRVEGLHAEAVAVLARQAGGDVLLINPTSVRRDDPALWPGSAPAQAALIRDGLPVAVQPVADGLLIDAGALEPYSLAPLVWQADGAPAKGPIALICDDHLLENEYLKVDLDERGDICRIYDKVAEREVLPQGTCANQWQAFEDRPVNWDAWDVDIFYDHKRYLAEPADSIRLIERGPLRATIEVRRRILHSEYTQTISLMHNRPQIDFETVIDWRERHILLKAAFPVDILSPAASYEVQWGHVERSTHRNTSWDWARFESCAQKWVDLSENSYGVSLLNDCKYGHDIRDNVIRVSLLRSPTHPDPEADQGAHRFAYSLLVHGSSGAAAIPLSETVARAYQLNDPILAVTGTAQPPAQARSMFSVTGSALIETVKRAEDGNGVILRLYQSQRRREWVTLHTALPLKAAFITNLLEDNQEPLSLDGQSVRIYLKPFQILTLRLIGESG